MRVIVEDDYEAMSDRAFEIFKRKLHDARVLGFATGSTPLGLYGRISDGCGNGELSLKNKISFNLDEYYPISRSDARSYRHFMEKNLFSKTDLPEGSINFPDAELQESEAVLVYSATYAADGPVDLQILGIGANGHIAFNEPGCTRNSRIRVVELSDNTVERNGCVSARAITMGIAEILESKSILLMASGRDKADAVMRMARGGVTGDVPASFLQLHDDVVAVLDEEAAAML